MKTKSEDQAKGWAKALSLNEDQKDVAIYIIHCNRTECFYVDTDSLIRHWEQLIGYYVNGEYTPEEQDIS